MTSIFWACRSKHKNIYILIILALKKSTNFRLPGHVPLCRQPFDADLEDRFPYTKGSFCLDWVIGISSRTSTGVIVKSLHDSGTAVFLPLSVAKLRSKGISMVRSQLRPWICLSSWGWSGRRHLFRAWFSHGVIFLRWRGRRAKWSRRKGKGTNTERRKYDIVSANVARCGKLDTFRFWVALSFRGVIIQFEFYFCSIYTDFGLEHKHPKNWGTVVRLFEISNCGFE